MKLIYKPFGIVVGRARRLVSKKIFGAIWGDLRPGGAPEAHDARDDVAQGPRGGRRAGRTFRVTRAVVDRYGAKGFAA
jgi:hypothetical protein